MSRRPVAVVLIIGVASASLLLSGEARAELPRPFGETEGLVLELGFGGNGLTDDDYVDDIIDADVDPLLGFHLAGYYRFMPYLSVGLLAHLGFLNPHSDLDDELSGFFGLLIEAKGHLPLARFDPWVGFGIGYATAFSAGEGELDLGILGEVDYEGDLALHGVAFSLALGLNIFVTRNLALAPFFRIIFGAYPGGCYEYTAGSGAGRQHEDECDDLEELYGVDDEDDLPDRPHLWVVGANVSYTI